MLSKIIIGNVLSFVGAIFLSVSCVLKKREYIYLFQSIECMFLVAAQIFFGQLGAAAVLILSTIRNAMLAFGAYSSRSLAILFSLTLIFGLAFNTGGAVGLIPLIASLAYTVTSYYAKSFSKIKLSLLFNLFIWCVYSYIIFDFAGLAVNFVSFVLNAVSFVKFKSGSDLKRKKDAP